MMTSFAKNLAPAMLSRNTLVSGLLAMLVLISSESTRAYGGEDRRFYKEYTDAGHDVAIVLINHGICERERKNCAGNIFFMDPIRGGFDFTVYGVEDPSVLEEINNVLMRKFYETPMMEHVTMEFYKKGVSNTSIFKSETDLISKVDLRRGK